MVPSPDAIKLAVPKAFVVLKPGHAPTRDAALDILRFLRGRLSAYKRVRRIEFAELPKTISGKIRRVQLRQAEDERRARERTRAAGVLGRGFRRTEVRVSAQAEVRRLRCLQSCRRTSALPSVPWPAGPA